MADAHAVGGDALGPITMRRRVRRAWTSAATLLQGSQRQSYAFTFFVEFLILLAGLATFKVTADLLGTAGFGEYMVARRAISLLAFPLLFGLAIGIPRYIALSGTGGGDALLPTAYLCAGLGICTPLLAAFAILALRFDGVFATSVFGTAAARGLVPPIVVAVAGLCLYSIVHGYYRGRLRMWTANLLQFSGLGALPLVVLLFSGPDAGKVLLYTGVGWIAVALAAAGWGARTMRFRGLSLLSLRDRVRELVTYGAPRVPGEFAFFGLFALPTFLVAHQSSIELAGFFSFGLALLQALTSMFSSASILLLPIIGRYAAEGRWREMRSAIARMLRFSLALTAVMVAGLELFLRPVVIACLGPSFTPVVDQARWLLLGAGPYVVFLILRSPLDAVAVWPHNAINLTVTLAVTTALMWLGGTRVPPSLAVCCGFMLLALLTLRSWKRSIAGSGDQIAEVIVGEPSATL